MIRSLIGIATVILYILPVEAAIAQSNWVLISEDSGTKFYVDPSTKKIAGNAATIWTLNDFKYPEKYSDGSEALSEAALSQYDCYGDRGRTLSLVVKSGHMLEGSTIISADQPFEWRHTVPGTAGAVILKYACGK